MGVTLVLFWWGVRGGWKMVKLGFRLGARFLLFSMFTMLKKNSYLSLAVRLNHATMRIYTFESSTCRPSYCKSGLVLGLHRFATRLQSFRHQHPANLQRNACQSTDLTMKFTERLITILLLLSATTTARTSSIRCRGPRKTMIGNGCWGRVQSGDRGDHNPLPFINSY
jgi:hypothetical protein